MWSDVTCDFAAALALCGKAIWVQVCLANFLFFTLLVTHRSHYAVSSPFTAALGCHAIEIMQRLHHIPVSLLLPLSSSPQHILPPTSHDDHHTT